MDEAHKLSTADLPTAEREINGVRYVVTRGNLWEVMDYSHRLIAILGKDLEGVVDPGATVAEVLALVADFSWDGVVRALVGAALRGTSKDGQDLVELLARQTQIEDGDHLVRLDKRSKAGTWFAQRPLDLAPWVGWCVEVQVKDFLEPLRDPVETVRARAKKESPPQESPSPST